MQHSDEPERFTPVANPRPNDVAWPVMTWPVPRDTELIGETVRLSALNPAADAAELLQALDHDAVWAHVPGRPVDSAGFRQALDQRCALADWRPWVIRLRRSIADLPAGAIIGTTSYLDAHPRDAWLEVGFTIYTPAVWATAVNPEAKLRRDDGTIRDSVLFSITAEEWPEVRGRLTERVRRGSD